MNWFQIVINIVQISADFSFEKEEDTVQFTSGMLHHVGNRS